MSSAAPAYHFEAAEKAGTPALRLTYPTDACRDVYDLGLDRDFSVGAV
jgi:hypothetical protein